MRFDPLHCTLRARATTHPTISSGPPLVAASLSTAHAPPPPKQQGRRKLAPARPGSRHKQVPGKLQRTFFSPGGTGVVVVVAAGRLQQPPRRRAQPGAAEAAGQPASCRVAGRRRQLAASRPAALGRCKPLRPGFWRCETRRAQRSQAAKAFFLVALYVDGEHEARCCQCLWVFADLGG